MNKQSIGKTLLVIGLSSALAYVLYKQNKTIKRIDALLSYVQVPEREHYQPPPQQHPPQQQQQATYYPTPHDDERNQFIEPRKEPKPRKTRNKSRNKGEDIESQSQKFIVEENLEDSLLFDGASLNSR